jgi:hypothetical protein
MDERSFAGAQDDCTRAPTENLRAHFPVASAAPGAIHRRISELLREWFELFSVPRAT